MIIEKWGYSYLHLWNFCNIYLLWMRTDGEKSWKRFWRRIFKRNLERGSEEELFKRNLESGSEEELFKSTTNWNPGGRLTSIVFRKDHVMEKVQLRKYFQKNLPTHVKNVKRFYVQLWHIKAPDIFDWIHPGTYRTPYSIIFKGMAHVPNFWPGLIWTDYQKLLLFLAATNCERDILNKIKGDPLSQEWTMGPWRYPQAHPSGSNWKDTWSHGGLTPTGEGQAEGMRAHIKSRATQPPTSSNPWVIWCKIIYTCTRTSLSGCGGFTTQNQISLAKCTKSEVING